MAGREDILSNLDPFETSLRAARAPSRELILYGPRGNGKTALLGEIHRRLARSIPNLQPLLLTPDEIPDTQALCRALIREKPGKALLRRLQAIRRVDVSLSEKGMPGVGVEFEAPQEQLLLADVLRDRSEAGPLLIILDEAHGLPLEVGRALLNATQKTRKDGRPILLVLAGTPDLDRRLSKIQATFWDRSKVMPVHRLSEPDAVQALAKPLEDHDVAFDPGALSEAAADSGGYPYFIQLWGQALTSLGLYSGDCVNGKHVRQAKSDVDAERNWYYGRRFAELRQGGLLSAAQAVHYAFQNVGPVEELALVEQIRQACPEGTPAKWADDALEALSRLGYVWAVGTEFFQGIPSLMDYVAAKAAKMDVSEFKARTPIDT